MRLFPFPGRLFAPALLLLSACVISTACGGAPTQAHAPATSAPISARSRLLTEAPGHMDADRDGLPDVAELRSFNDRENFRRWFTGIAETQFYALSPAWNEAQRDCSGLVRFALREALRPHDRLWFQKMGAGYESFAPDVRAADRVRAALGDKLFRTSLGAFSETDLDDRTFSEFADARTLKDYNSDFVGRDHRQARPGDLLFFYQPWAQAYPHHVMIFLGPAREAGEGAADWVVYHTGASADDQGTIKKVRLAVLNQHPDPRWRPVAGNKNFLGFYRLKMLQ
ncbi:MAG: DUF1175 family protein [Pyrinomonadaceae bacterium]